MATKKNTAKPRAKATVTWVIPCYNEAERLREDLVAELLEGDTHCRVLLVDDGSKDATLALLHDIQGRLGKRVGVHALAQNSGKAEAVREGLKIAIAPSTGKAPFAVGYLDADFATPPPEAHRLGRELRAGEATVVLGARVRRLGTQIDRDPMRHYLGRVFSTVAALSLGLEVYDTQCGAKLFVVSEPLQKALVDPFKSRWAFDVELIGRLLDAGLTADNFIEVPLHVWQDVGGSKLTRGAMFGAGMDLLGIAKRRLWR